MTMTDDLTPLIDKVTEYIEENTGTEYGNAGIGQYEYWGAPGYHSDLYFIALYQGKDRVSFTWTEEISPQDLEGICEYVEEWEDEVSVHRELEGQRQVFEDTIRIRAFIVPGSVSIIEQSPKYPTDETYRVTFSAMVGIEPK